MYMYPVLRFPSLFTWPSLRLIVHEAPRAASSNMYLLSGPVRWGFVFELLLF